MIFRPFNPLFPSAGTTLHFCEGVDTPNAYQAHYRLDLDYASAFKIVPYDVLEEVSAAHGESIAKHPFFPAIADMSFVAPVDRDELSVVATNTPLWDQALSCRSAGLGRSVR